MKSKKTPQAFITKRKIADAVNSGCQTSRQVSEQIGAHIVTVQTKMQDMHAEGYLIRRKIGQTYIYAVKEGVEIKEEPEWESRLELAKKIKEAKERKK